MWTKTTTLTALLFIARFGSGVEAEALRSLKSKPSNKSSKAGKTVCLEFGFETDVVLPDGPIPPRDQTCDPLIPPTYTTPNPLYDPEQCPIYFEPLLLEDPSSASSQYEQVDGRDALCIVNPLSSTDAGDKFFMSYVGTLSSDLTDTTGLLFPDTPLSDFEKLSYDFYVDDCQGIKPSCPEQFYAGVYARESAAKTNFFDCRINFVPDTGGVEGTWTTFTFTADTPGRNCGNSACTVGCVGTSWTAGDQHSLNEYIAEVPGAVLSSGFAQAFNLNIGDSAAGDAGLRGCYGDIRFTLAGNTDVLKFTA
jgi:hypothetical protein